MQSDTRSRKNEEDRQRRRGVFGDGAIQNGAAYESFNLAALYRLPVIFFCENNLYAVSTHITEQTREPRLSGRGVSLRIPV